MRKIPLVTGEIYHIFNRGVNRSNIFYSKRDYRRFLDAASHYKSNCSKFTLPNYVDDTGSAEEIVEVLAYCLMSNHFHLLLKQLVDNGITSYLRHLANSYSHYVNVKYGRIGPLFQGRFKNVLVETDEQLIHVSRYIHLNPLVSGLIADLKDYPWSSYLKYIDQKEDDLVDSSMIGGYFKSPDKYERFVLDQVDYGMELERIKHLIVD